MSRNNNNQSVVELGKVHVETHNAKLFNSWKATRPARCLLLLVQSQCGKTTERQDTEGR